ncbi:MAG: TolC family protein [Vicingaceae bacterium]
MKYCYLIFSALFIVLSAASQNSELGESLDYKTFMQRVKTEHPLSKQAKLQQQFGEAEVRGARGFFDPKTYAQLSQKYFDDKQYYSKLEGGVKIPTWFGIEVMGGYEDNEGDFLNPENSVPGNGLYFAGVSVPVGQGLFIDQRRAALKSAKIYAKSTQATQRFLLNQLYLDATKAYWKWFQAYHQKEVFEEAIELANIRLQAVKQGAVLGDRPDIDTLEAGIQVQNRALGLQQAQLDYKNARALLNVYLWDEGLIPLELEDETTPPVLDSIASEAAEVDLLLGLDTLISQHPELLLSQFEIDQLEVDRRLKAEMLKPNLNVKYQPIVEGVGDEVLSNFNQNNYQWGLEFSFPILLRKERGSLQKTKLKLQEKQFDLENKNQNLAFKAKAAFNEWQTTKEQADLYSQNTRDYFGLLEGERNLFQTGESSLFLVNRREVGYINAQLKWIEVLAKNHVARAKAYYSLGILPQQ